jgi:hypothetical protein
MQIENQLPFAVVVCTYDVGDFLFWLPWQVHNLEPGVTRSIAAHDHGRCKLKIEIVDGSRIWVLASPTDAIYAEGDVIRIGPSFGIDMTSSTPRDPDRARDEFLHRNRDLLVLADEWIPNARRSRSYAVVRAVLGDDA